MQYSPYVIPCPDYKFTNETNGDIYFSRALPFLQFLLRLDGRPITGERMLCAQCRVPRRRREQAFQKNQRILPQAIRLARLFTANGRIFRMMSDCAEKWFDISESCISLWSARILCALSDIAKGQRGLLAAPAGEGYPYEHVCKRRMLSVHFKFGKEQRQNGV